MGRFRLGSTEFVNIFKVLLWTMLGGAAASGYAYLQSLDIPPEYMFYGGLANTILYTAREFFADNRPSSEEG